MNQKKKELHQYDLHPTQKDFVKFKDKHDKPVLGENRDQSWDVF